VAKLVYEDSGIRTAEKLTEILGLKRHDAQITLYALLHYLVNIFKEQGQNDYDSSQFANALQKCLLKHL
jgi:hypothetical protein